jgi:hypothetical protein
VRGDVSPQTVSTTDNIVIHEQQQRTSRRLSPCVSCRGNALQTVSEDSDGHPRKAGGEIVEVSVAIVHNDYLKADPSRKNLLTQGD